MTQRAYLNWVENVTHRGRGWPVEAKTAGETDAYAVDEVAVADVVAVAVAAGNGREWYERMKD